MPKEELRTLLRDNGLRFVYGVVPVDWTTGNYGLAGQPEREDEFRRAADLGLEYAAYCDFWSLQVGHGSLPRGVDRQRCIETVARNLDYICDQAKGTDLRIVIEPVSTARFNIPFVLSTMEHGAQVLRMVNNERLKLVFDTYHLRMEEQGPLSAILDAYWPEIGHVQICNSPTHFEPGDGRGRPALHHRTRRCEGLRRLDRPGIRSVVRRQLGEPRLARALRLSDPSAQLILGVLMSTGESDIVIIGAGHNALTAAAYLAKAGFR